MIEVYYTRVKVPLPASGEMFDNRERIQLYELLITSSEFVMNLNPESDTDSYTDAHDDDENIRGTFIEVHFENFDPNGKTGLKLLEYCSGEFYDQVKILITNLE